MKNNTIKSLGCLFVVCLILAVFCLLATGCSSNSPQNDIVGVWSWYVDDGDPISTFQFFSDGTVDMDGWYTANYTIEDTTLRIETTGISLKYTCTFNDDGTKMYWSDPSDTSFGEVVLEKDGGTN